MFMKALQRILKECDVIISVADGRVPDALFIPKVNKRKLLVINKVDLIDADEIERIRRKHRNAIFVSAKYGRGKGRLLHKLIEIAKKMNLDIRVGVIGYPNAGKSSIINMLKGKRSAKVSATPGETKGVQWLRIRKNILMYDTPGVVMRGVGERGLVKASGLSAQNVKDPEGAASEIITEIIRKGLTSRLARHYDIKIDERDSPQKIIAKIAARHRMLMKGGEKDLERAARKVIYDWQTGKIH
ncbi:MAG: GTPase [Candidatus Micrarchaeia archaeon]